MNTDQCCCTAAPIACNLDAISPSDRPRYDTLRAMLRAAAVGKRVLPDGIAIHISTDRMPLTQLAEWISFERRCCPFLDFTIDVAADSGPVWISLTGRPGVKEFLAHALSR